MDRTTEAAVLFVDVSESTHLYESAGNATALAAIESCLALVLRATASSGGRVIKTMGDGVMAVFPTADAAADSAIEMHGAIEQLAPVAGSKLAIRIGFHCGPVVEQDGDVFGDTVNVAARLAGLASKDQIITSRETVESMSPALKGASRALYSIHVKGKTQKVELCEVLWKHTGEATTVAISTPGDGSAQTILRLRYRGAEIVFEGSQTIVSMGRDKTSDLVILDPMASRAHGRIERRLNKFALVDHSANGTYVTIEGEREIVLRREDFILHGHGWITFGQPRENTSEAVEFSCEDVRES